MEESAPQTKVCRLCPEKGEQPITAFYPKKGGKNGVEAVCSTCRKAAQWEKRDRLSSGSLVIPVDKQCEQCGGTKSSVEFYTNPERVDGLYEKCIACVLSGRRIRAAKVKEQPKPKEKKCKECGSIKPSSEFYNHSGVSDGLDPLCIICKQKRRNKRNLLIDTEVVRLGTPTTTGRGHKSTVPVRTRTFRTRVKHLYGLSLEEYNQVLIDQDYKCAICRVDFREAEVNIDHCHAGGAVRGLLCRRCNLALGHLEYLRNDPTILQNTLKYLKKSQRYGGRLLTDNLAIDKRNRGRRGEEGNAQD